MCVCVGVWVCSVVSICVWGVLACLIQIQFSLSIYIVLFIFVCNSVIISYCLSLRVVVYSCSQYIKHVVSLCLHLCSLFTIVSCCFFIFTAVSVSIEGETSLTVREDMGTVSLQLQSEGIYVTAFTMAIVCGATVPPQATGWTKLMFFDVVL